MRRVPHIPSLLINREAHALVKKVDQLIRQFRKPASLSLLYYRLIYSCKPIAEAAARLSSSPSRCKFCHTAAFSQIRSVARFELAPRESRDRCDTLAGSSGKRLFVSRVAFRARSPLPAVRPSSSSLVVRETVASCRFVSLVRLFYASESERAERVSCVERVCRESADRRNTRNDRRVVVGCRSIYAAEFARRFSICRRGRSLRSVSSPFRIFTTRMFTCCSPVPGDRRECHVVSMRRRCEKYRARRATRARTCFVEISGDD